MALQVVSDFEHAAVERVRVVESDRRVYFAAPLGDSPRGMWFHFKLAGGDGAPVAFVLTNREHMLGAGDYQRAVPVFRHGEGPWRRVDPADCQAHDPSPVRSFSDSRRARHTFSFVAPCGPGITEIAYCYPYTLTMIDQAVERWSRSRGVAVQTLCRTAGGRPLRLVRIGSPAPGKKVIWVLARQHSGEVPGSYAAEGLVDAVLGRTAWAASLRRRAVLYVCPAVDVDGVAEGLYGKDRAPVDFNRDWRACPVRPEIAALRKAMDSSRVRCAGKGGRMLAMLDLHAPGPGGVSFPVPPHPAWAGREGWQRAWWMAKLIERFCSDAAPIRWANSGAEHIDWSPPNGGGRNASTFHAAAELADHSMTVELTYNWQANNTLVAPDDWRRMGQAIARALEALARNPNPPKNIRPPDPPNYLSPFWAWLNMPRQCNAKVNEDMVSIQADGPQGFAALLFCEPIALGRGRFSASAGLYRTSHGKCPLQRLIFYFKDGVFTGEVSEQKGELGNQSNLQWRAPTTLKRPADSARLGIVIRNWVGTITIVRPQRDPASP